MTCRIPADFAERAKVLKWILTDCDGVLTDGGVYYGEHGEVMKRFNIRDGMGVERLRNLAGIQTGVVTGEFSPSLVKRAQKLGITEINLGAKDKETVVRGILDRLQISTSELLYIGDDVNDLPAFPLAGLTACPGDAEDTVKARADLILSKPGGHGAFRELAELILSARAAMP
jgi:3-deoxy-D-manno-octulosonate 8-phosphate phosphatase (KDO 8-P phosphatase)